MNSPLSITAPVDTHTPAAPDDLAREAARPATQDRPLRGRVVLITGAGQGLGAALARELGAQGARLALADQHPQRAEDESAALAGAGIEARAYALDVADPAQCIDVVTRVDQHFGRLDVLVNNAATDVTAPMDELTVPDWLRILHTNLTGPFVLSKYAAARMADHGGGHIVNIASTASKRAWPNASAYHASKWGLLGLSHALHAELRPQGIHVCAVVAGGMRTPFLLDRFPTLDPALLQEPAAVARAIRHVLSQPAGSCVAEITVLPERETSWP
ncbi:SDR family oxidoreductase [Pelomonas sp. APW6]|uniref:SDR family oxidoreductase n=1 Tax=Roseateles subflavus TaxID=3053353 RepID=A0ABT7LLS2_9BURK|nr:SDR family oxidoreductase [Pelomonas sp. APW6]MDL5033811.1 SDR family oxidoreductase [Pelomonas sp. APW6]